MDQWVWGHTWVFWVVFPDLRRETCPWTISRGHSKRFYRRNTGIICLLDTIYIGKIRFREALEKMRVHEIHYKFYRFLSTSEILYPKLWPQNKPNTLDRHSKLLKNKNTTSGILWRFFDAHQPLKGAVIPKGSPFQVSMEKPTCPKTFWYLGHSLRGRTCTRSKFSVPGTC